MSPLAVIPGLAPSLIAVLPLVIVLFFGTIALLFSPAAWWRLGKAVLRRPVRSAAILLAGVFLIYGAVRLAAHIPIPAPGAAIPETVAGFPIGDPDGSRWRASGPGPLHPGGAVFAAAFETQGAGERMTVVGKRVVLSTRGGKTIACADPLRGELIWKRSLEAPLIAGPLGFERRTETEAVTSGLVIVTASGALEPAGWLGVLDGKDGNLSGRAHLPSGPTSHAALVDDRALVVLDESVACFLLSGPGAPRLAWNAPRPARAARGLAGDLSGRFFLLDAERLLEGDLRNGSLRDVARFDHESPARLPARLAVRESRAFVLTVGAPDKARVHCIDPSPRGPWPETGSAGAVIWTVEAARPAGDEFCVASFGVVLGYPREMLILDASTGDRRGMLSLDAPLACPPALGDSSLYLLLSGGRILRCLPGLDRIDWSRDLPASAGFPPLPPMAGAPGALVVAGDRLVASFQGRHWVIPDGQGVESPPWSHFRGGADRAGTCEGARMPLRAKVLWRRRAGGDAEPPVKPVAPCSEAAPEVAILPLPEGWLVAAPSGGRTLHSWLDDGGSLLAERRDEGCALGAVRIEERIFAPMELSHTEGAVLCLSAERQSDRASLKELWRAPTPPFSGARPIAAGEEMVVIALRSSLLAIAASDGRRRWESRGVAGAGPPLCANGRVIASGDDPGEGGGAIVALAAADGSLLWRRREPGWRWGPATSKGEVILVPAERGGRGLIEVIRPGDGAILRSVLLDGEAAGGPLASAGGQVFYAGRSGGAFLLSDGGKAPVRLSPDGMAAGGKGAGAAPFVPPGVPPIAGFDLVVSASGPALRCIDTLTQDTLWEAALPAAPSDAALERGRIAVAAGGEVLCLGSE